MIRMISVVDLSTGAWTHRPASTPTFDLPEDFDGATSIAALDSRSHAHYNSTMGKEISRAVFSRPLSWRVRGERCLVADSQKPPTPAQRSSYTFCRVEPE